MQIRPSAGFIGIPRYYIPYTIELIDFLHLTEELKNNTTSHCKRMKHIEYGQECKIVLLSYEYG